mmetsp:Transcript_111102/g.299629  ORF Transcript_111102/g.299629 Transcript_111102/m.299629 type:complete len:411 (-) Transcript_111102:47-1279(-)
MSWYDAAACCSRGPCQGETCLCVADDSLLACRVAPATALPADHQGHARAKKGNYAPWGNIYERTTKPGPHNSHGGNERRQLLSSLFRLLLDLLRCEDLVEQAVRHGLIWRHVATTLCVLDDLVLSLARGLGQQLCHRGPVRHDLAREHLEVRGLPCALGRGLHRLGEHDRRVRQCESLALGTEAEQNRGGAVGLADGNGVHRRLDVRHAICDGKGVCLHANLLLTDEPGVVLHRRPRAVDVHRDRLVSGLVVQIQKLCKDQLRDLVGDGSAQVDDAVLQQQGGQVRRWADGRPLVGLPLRGVGLQLHAGPLRAAALAGAAPPSALADRDKAARRRRSRERRYRLAGSGRRHTRRTFNGGCRCLCAARRGNGRAQPWRRRGSCGHEGIPRSQQAAKASGGGCRDLSVSGIH